MFCFDFCLVLFWFLFVLSLYIEIFYYEIFLETEKMWEISRKIEFSEYNQTLENIFQNIFWNATKYLKIFSFFENIFTWKYFTLGKYFTFNQTQTRVQWIPSTTIQKFQIFFHAVLVLIVLIVCLILPCSLTAFKF